MHYRFFYKEFAMGKSFWVVLCLFAVCLFASVFATFSIEEYRWQRVTTSLNDLVESMKTRSEQRDELIKSLRLLGEGVDAREMEITQEQKKKMGKIALDAIAKIDEGEEEFWEFIPGLQAFFNQERKTNFRNLLFSALTLAFALFVVVAAVKTKKHFSREAVELTRQRNEIERSNASLADREQKLRREQDRLSAESSALEKLRETFDQERRKFRREVAIFQHKHRQSGKADLPANHGRDGPATPQTPKEAVELPPTVGAKAQVTSLAPWKFWVTFSQNDEGYPLPQEKDHFITALKSDLAKAGLRSLKAERIYKSLLLLIERLEKRQRIWQIGYTDLRGWKKWRIGMKHRLIFIRVGEHEVRFLPPITRDKAYRPK